MSLIPDPADHSVHVLEGLPKQHCPECRNLRRWPVTKIGYMIPQGDGSYKPVGWEFETSIPDTVPWIVADMHAFVAMERWIQQLPEIPEHERNARP